MINVIHYGDVAFLPTIFYRSVTQQWPGETRGQEGLKQVLSDWDVYRGGIEYMIQRAFNYAGAPTVPPEQRPVVSQMVQSFINVRMNVAFRLLLGRHQFVDAFDVFARLMATDGVSAADTERYRSMVCVPAALEAFLETFRSITWASCVGLFRNENSAAVRQLLVDLDASLPVQVLDDADLDALEDKHRFLVLSGNGDKRDLLLKAGFPPGQVWAEEDLLRQFQV
jgi:hypothetical protein